MTLALTLAACGSQGNAPTLPAPRQVALTVAGSGRQIATATLTPVRAGRVVAYLGGALIPYDNARTPAQLRRGGCAGLVLAALTADAPAPTGAAASGGVAFVRPDPAGGVDVALTPGADWTVVVLDHAGAAAATPIACGNPLSARRQYFDLYPPDVGSSGTARGLALLDPLVFTRVAVSLAAPAAQPAAWALHMGGCDGATLATGAIAPGALTGGGMAFVAPDYAHWWVALSSPGGALACARVGV